MQGNLSHAEEANHVEWPCFIIINSLRIQLSLWGRINLVYGSTPVHLTRFQLPRALTLLNTTILGTKSTSEHQWRHITWNRQEGRGAGPDRCLWMSSGRDVLWWTLDTTSLALSSVLWMSLKPDSNTASKGCVSSITSKPMCSWQALWECFWKNSLVAQKAEISSGHLCWCKMVLWALIMVCLLQRLSLNDKILLASSRDRKRSWTIKAANRIRNHHYSTVSK